MAQLEYIADILLKERLFCSPYYRLNDPFEGQFRVASYTIAGSPGNYRRVEYLSDADIETFIDAEDANFRVCSLTKTYEDVRLWALYAGGHRGVAIEIDAEGLRPRPRKVYYKRKLATYRHRAGYVMPVTPAKALSQKTTHWSYEKEYRLITTKEYIEIPGCIKRVIAGPRCNRTDIEILKRLVAKQYPLIHTRLDKDNMRVCIRK